MSLIVDRALRIVLTGIHALMKASWFVRRPKTYGAHAIALTAEGKIVLVKLRYAPGWRVPGGGRPKEESPAEAAIRELREEIGLVSHGEVRLARDFDESTRLKRDTVSLVVVRDVRYRPRRWSWEVERICEAEMDSLPDDMSPTCERWIDELRPLLR